MPKTTAKKRMLTDYSTCLKCGSTEIHPSGYRKGIKRFICDKGHCNYESYADYSNSDVDCPLQGEGFRDHVVKVGLKGDDQRYLCKTHKKTFYVRLQHQNNLNEEPSLDNQDNNPESIIDDNTISLANINNNRIINILNQETTNIQNNFLTIRLQDSLEDQGEHWREYGFQNLQQNIWPFLTEDQCSSQGNNTNDCDELFENLPDNILDTLTEDQLRHLIGYYETNDQNC